MSLFSKATHWAGHEFHHALNEAGHVLHEGEHGLKNGFDAAVHKAYELGKAAEEKIYNELRQSYFELKNHLAELQVLANHLKALANHIKDDAEAFAQKVEEALKAVEKKLAEVIKAIKSLPEEIEKYLGTDRLQKIVHAIAKFEDHIVGGMKSFLSKLKDLGDDITDWVRADRLKRLAGLLLGFVDRIGEVLAAAGHVITAIPKGLEIAEDLVLGKNSGASKDQIADSLAGLAVAIAPLSHDLDLPLPALPPCLAVPASDSLKDVRQNIMDHLNRIPDPIWEFASPKMDTAEVKTFVDWVADGIAGAEKDANKVPIKAILAGITSFRAWVDQTKPILSIDVDLDLLDNLSVDVNAGDASGAADGGAGGDGEGGGFAGIVIFEGHAFFWGLLDIVFDTLISILGLVSTIRAAKSA